MIHKLSRYVNSTSETRPLTWNFFVAAFLSSVEALKSLSGRVLVWGVMCECKAKYEMTKFRADFKDSFLYACPLSSVEAFFGMLRIV
jgi:hypothetical protein